MFLAFEGIDGSGKSTVARKVAEALEANGMDVIFTAEPTSNELGSLLRSYGQESFAEAMLFMADRAKHITEMRAQLKEGKIVIVDRYYMSTCAYQGATLANHFETMNQAVRWLLSCHRPFLMKPDMIFLLKINPEESLQRLTVRDELTKFEKVEFLQKVSENYQYLVGTERGSCTINATQPVDKVVKDVLSCIESRRMNDLMDKSETLS
jgi:dTMP kinase